jgi:ATP-dependent Clp protease ATP-binding subunit ClpA
MTTNAGSQNGSGVMGFGENAQAQSESKTSAALSECLRPEFINRVDEIITFRSLDEKDFEQIAVIMLDELKAALRLKGHSLAYDDGAVRAVAKNSFSVRFGARNMRRYIQTEIEDEIAEQIISRKAKEALISVTGNGETGAPLVKVV